MKNLLVHFFACFTATSMTGCAASLATAHGFVAKEIEYVAYGSVGVEGFYWTSDNEVLFAGKRLGEPANARYRLVSWDTTTGRIHEHMLLGSHPNICFDRGYVRVTYILENRPHGYAGLLGRPLEPISTGLLNLPPDQRFNRHTCRIEPRRSPARPNHSVIEVLRTDHGHVEAERPSEPLPQRRYYLVRSTGEVVPTALRGAAGAPRYSQFRNAYVFQDGGGVAGPKVVRHIQVLDVAGQTVVYKLPAGEWMRGTIRALPVQGAIFMVSHAVPNADGGYLVASEEVRLIVKGYIRQFAVSPDGCKVAMNINPEEKVVARMAVINVCNGGN